jgi:hypothetical protein
MQIFSMNGVSVQPVVRGIGVVTNEGQAGIHMSIEVDDVTFGRYSDGISAVMQAVTGRQFDLIERNRKRIASVAAYYQELFRMRRRSEIFHPQSSVETLAFEVLNWLTATRLFLDHHLTSFTHKYGKNSAELLGLKEKMSEQYDSSLAYRFLYKLRDYTQHCGFPVDQVAVGHSENDESGNENIRVLFTASRDRLLRDFDWNAKVRQDLRSMPERIDVLEMIEQVAPCFRKIFAQIVRVRLEGIERSVETIEEMARLLEGVEGDPHLFEFALDGEQNVSNISMTPVPVGVVSWHRHEDGPEKLLTRLEKNSDLDEPTELAAPSSMSPEFKKSMRLGAAVLNVYFENGGSGSRYVAAVNNLASDFGDLSILVDGLTTLAAVSLSMTAAAVGTNARDILGGFIID